MAEKDTSEFENEILQVANEDELQDFIDENQENLPEMTLAEYLEFLLKEKKLSKTDIVKSACMGNYAYKIFSGEPVEKITMLPTKLISSENISKTDIESWD